MKELSLNILDIAENSVKARASLVEITITETDDTMRISIRDNGIGMTRETLDTVTDPFFTTRTTRKVGMGIPLFKFAAEQTGGSLKITSVHIDDSDEGHGTEIVAMFYKNHIDFTPLGDVIASVTTLIQGHPDVDFLFTHNREHRTVSLDTRELREVLEDVPLDNYEVLLWIKGSLEEQYNTI